MANYVSIFKGDEIDAALAAVPNKVDKEVGKGLSEANFTNAEKAQLASAAPLASPAFTGVPTAPTAPVDTNNTQVANTAFVQQATNTTETDIRNSLEYGTATINGEPASRIKPLQDVVNLEWPEFGGATYNGSTDCLPAFLAAKAAVGSGRIIISGKAGDIVLFDNFPNAAEILVGPLLDVAEGVVIRINQPDGLTMIYGNSTIRVVRTTAFYEATSDTWAYISPQTSVHVQDKLQWMTAADADYTEITAIPMDTAVSAKKLNWDGSGDTFDADVFSSASASQIVVNTAHDGFVHLGMIPVNQGDYLSASFSAWNSTESAVVALVRCEGGYYGIYGSNANSSITSFSKLIGASRVTTNANTEGSPFSQYRVPASVMGIKIHSNQHFSITCNGVDYHNVHTDSPIVEAGFGGYDLGATATVLTMDDYTLRTKTPAVNGVKALNIACFGDSITAGSGAQHVYGSWPEQLKRILDGVAGVRVKNILNYAVSGATSGTQLPLVTAPNIATADYVIFMLGTNDIQGGVTISTYLGNMSTMINTALTAGKRVIVAIPPMFYTTSDAATTTGNPSGNATTNSASGAVYRSGLMRLCATLGVKVVDTLGGLGSIIAPFLDKTTYLDSMVTDNIHPSVYGRLLLGQLFAQAILGDIASKNDDSYVNVDLPSTGLAGGFTFTTEQGRYTKTSSGQVYITGTIDVGAAVADGTTVYTLPLHLRPKYPQRFVCFNGESSFSYLVVDPATGNILIYSAPTTATFVSLQINYSAR